MKAVILAAGTGTRLMPFTKRLPKALIRIDGKSLLQRSLEALSLHGVTEAIIVVGHLGDMIRKAIGNECSGMSVRYIESPNYADTGSMSSLYQIKDVLDGDILLLESDLLYEPRAIRLLLNSEYPDAILVGGLLHSGDDVYVCMNGREKISKLGKNLSEEDRRNAGGALVGISRISSRFLRRVFSELDGSRRADALNNHYEVVLFQMSDSDSPLRAVICEDLNWIEMDTTDDVRRARQEVYPRIIRDAKGRSGK